MTLRARAAMLAAVATLGACATSRPRPSREEPEGPAAGEPREGRWSEEGVASFYSRFHHGKLTASGERFDMNAMTAAHPRLPFGTRVRVTDLESGRAVEVRVNDRGPFAKGRVIDLSLAAATALGIVKRGLARVRLEPAD